MTRMDSTALLKLGHLSCGHAGRPVRDGVDLSVREGGAVHQ